MNAVWILDTCVFMAMMLWSLGQPRNEWVGNTMVALAATLLALWYQPAMPSILGGTGSPVSFPFHRLFGIPILVGVIWMAFQAWEDAKQERISRKSRD